MGIHIAYCAWPYEASCNVTRPVTHWAHRLLVSFAVSGAALVVGSLLFGAAAAFHPMLVGDGAAQLAVIAATPAWRTIHWLIAFGYVLVVPGVSGASTSYAGGAIANAARTGAAVTIFGYTISLVGVLFMLGPASELAAAYASAEKDQAAKYPVFLFDVLHPFALAAIRIGAFAISVGIAVLGWAERTRHRWLGWLGMGAGLMGTAAAIVSPARSVALVTGVALAAIWQVSAGAMLLTQAKRTSASRHP